MPPSEEFTTVNFDLFGGWPVWSYFALSTAIDTKCKKIVDLER